MSVLQIGRTGTFENLWSAFTLRETLVEQSGCRAVERRARARSAPDKGGGYPRQTDAGRKRPAPLPRLLGLPGKLGRAGTKRIADDLCPPQIELQEVGK